MRPIDIAAKLLNSSIQYLTPFKENDPLNEGNTLSGFINRKKGKTGGSLVITEVNGVAVEPYVVWGTPKLEYPYKPNTTDFKRFPEYWSAYLYEKWNGCNILFYKYYDASGVQYLTAKTKGTAVVKDGDYGLFLTLTKEAMARKSSMVRAFTTQHYQSMSCELCGTKEPHLVKYDFDLDLKPLFFITWEGRIKPVGEHVQNVDSANHNDGLVRKLQESQYRDGWLNKQYQLKHDLPPKYEYEHFITEGKVLYLLDKEGFVVENTLYKIKPRDIEEVHWATFEHNYQQRVEEAIQKLSRDEEPLTAANLQAELDMGPKEWDKFGDKVMKYLKNRGSFTEEVIILVGIPGSGKSTYAQTLVEQGYVRINQDDLGSRKACKVKMVEALRAGKNIVIDRCNFDINQRKTWIDLARQLGAKKISCTVFSTPFETCLERVKNRDGHPTITKDNPNIDNILTKMYNSYIIPTLEEGFHVINQKQD